MRLTLLSVKEIFQHAFLSVSIKFGFMPEEVNDYYVAIQILGRVITGEPRGFHVGHLDEMVLQLEDMYLKLERDGVMLEDALNKAYGLLYRLKQYAPSDDDLEESFTKIMSECCEALILVSINSEPFDDEETFPPK